MRFLRKNKYSKLVLVISDIHLGAGVMVKGQFNNLEDFHYDEEFVEFIEYYSSGDFSTREAELVINGDFFDLLAVPFVEYFDDEFWSEEAALEKLKLIIKAHPEVINSLSTFLKQKNKKIIFIVGNHDGEMILPKLQEYLLEQIDKDARSNFIIRIESPGSYSPLKGIIIKHGHEYELAHQFETEQSIQYDEEGKSYFIPPWGSYYVTRVINKFKIERDWINAVRPVEKALINGLIYDTVFMIRFLLANVYYFFMVRLLFFIKNHKDMKSLLKKALSELVLFEDYEELTSHVFDDKVKCVIVGHTHEPKMKKYSNGNIFINTGTWTNMYSLDWNYKSGGSNLTYAEINVLEEVDSEFPYEIFLKEWNGINKNPFSLY